MNFTINWNKFCATYIFSLILFVCSTKPILAQSLILDPLTGNLNPDCEHLITATFRNNAPNKSFEYTIKYSPQEVEISDIFAPADLELLRNSVLGEIRINIKPKDNVPIPISRKLFITFKAQIGAKNAHFSDISTNPTEELTTNASFRFTQNGICENDHIAPYILFAPESAFQQNEIRVEVVDPFVPIQLNNLKVFINGNRLINENLNPSTDKQGRIVKFFINPEEFSSPHQPIEIQITVTNERYQTSQSTYYMIPEQLKQNTNNSQSLTTDKTLRTEIFTNPRFVQFESFFPVISIGLLLLLIFGMALFIIEKPTGLIPLLKQLAGVQPKFTYGAVLDEASNRPIRFAQVLVLNGSLRGNGETFSNSKGLFGFNEIVSDQLTLKITKAGYITNEIKFTSDQLQSEIGFLDIKMTATYMKINANEKQLFVQAALYLQNSMRTLLPIIIYLSSALFAIVSVIRRQDLFTLSIIGLHIFTISMFLFYTTNRQNQHLRVVDARTKARVPNSLIKIIDLDTENIVDIVYTDRLGFAQYNPPKNCGIFVSKAGYKFPSEIQLGMITQKHKGSFLRLNSNNIILLDPLDQTLYG